MSKTEQASHLPEKDIYHVEWRGDLGFKTRRLLRNYKTTDNYEDTDKEITNIFEAKLFKEKVIQIINKDASNVAKYKILACIDAEKWEEIKTETTLAGNTSVKYCSNDIPELAKPFPFYKVVVASNVSGQSALIDCYMAGSTQ